MEVLNFFLCVYIRISFKDVHFNLNIDIDFRKAHFDHDQAFNIMFMKETDNPTEITKCIYKKNIL